VIVMLEKNARALSLALSLCLSLSRARALSLCESHSGKERCCSTVHSIIITLCSQAWRFGPPFLRASHSYLQFIHFITRRMCFLTLTFSSFNLIRTSFDGLIVELFIIKRERALGQQMSAEIPFAILMTLHLSHVSTFLPQSFQFLIYSMQLKLLFLHFLQNTPRRPHMMGNHTILFRSQNARVRAHTRKLATGIV
jgi:hypothetical protein